MEVVLNNELEVLSYDSLGLVPDEYIDRGFKFINADVYLEDSAGFERYSLHRDRNNKLAVFRSQYKIGDSTFVNFEDENIESRKLVDSKTITDIVNLRDEVCILCSDGLFKVNRINEPRTRTSRGKIYYILNPISVEEIPLRED